MFDCQVGALSFVDVMLTIYCVCSRDRCVLQRPLPIDTNAARVLDSLSQSTLYIWCL